MGGNLLYIKEQTNLERNALICSKALLLLFVADFDMRSSTQSLLLTPCSMSTQEALTGNGNGAQPVERKKVWGGGGTWIRIGNSSPTVSTIYLYETDD